MLRCILVIVLLALAPPIAAGDAVPPADFTDALEAGALEVGDSAIATGIVDGDTLVLADGRQVRLVGIQAPKLPLGRPNFVAWPLAEEAREALAELAQNRQLTLAYGGQQRDRHGRELAHLFDAEGGWIQGALLAGGWARVYGFADNRALLGRMLELEDAARRAGRGIWADAYYAVRPAPEAERYIGRFELIEGEVLEAAIVRGRGYLNFGQDWRSDFTASLAPKVVKRFAAEGLDPLAYQGRRLRVRGWIKSFNGAMIEITHPEQIEVLAE